MLIYGIVHSPTHLNLYLLRNLNLISWPSPRLPRSSSSPHINRDTYPRKTKTPKIPPLTISIQDMCLSGNPGQASESPFTASMGRVPMVPHVCTMYDVRIRKLLSLVNCRDRKRANHDRRGELMGDGRVVGWWYLAPSGWERSP